MVAPRSSERVSLIELVLSPSAMLGVTIIAGRNFGWLFAGGYDGEIDSPPC